MKYILKLLLNFFTFILSKIISFFIYLILSFFIIILIFSSLTSKNNKSDFLKYEHLVLENISNPSDDIIVDSLNFFGENNLSFKNVLDVISLAKDDNNIKDMVIDLNSVQFSPAQIEELTPLFKEFKSKGKKIIAHGRYLDNTAYSLAILADEIFLPNTENADILLGGYQKNILYYKDIFDKYGFKMEVIHIGDYKSFGEEYRESKISEELKSTITRINDIRLDEFIKNISENRKLNFEKTKEKLLNGDFAYISPKLARDLSIIDNLINYEKIEEIYDLNETNTISFESYFEKNYKEDIDDKEVIAVIYLNGDIEENPSNPYTPYISYTNFKDKLEAASKIQNLTGIIVRINSNGGSAYESKKIYDELTSLDIPLYISIGDSAASGGYYIASSGHKIFLNKSSITGSIGVVSMFPKYIGTLDKFNINTSTVSRGKYMNLTNPLVSLTKEDREVYRKKLNSVYEEFKNDILEVRGNLNAESLEKIAQGQIWLGSEAVENGLADEIGSLNDTINAMANDYEIKNFKVVNIYSKQDISSYKDIFKYNILPFFKNENVILDEITKKYNFIMNNKNKILFYADDFKIEF